MTRIVGEVMTREVVEAHRGTPFKELVRLLNRHGISGLPVVDHDDKVVGVISETDLIRRQAARSADGWARRPRIPWRGRSTRRADAVAGATTAAELMTTPAITVHPEQRIGDAARLMERHGVERLPVVDEADRLIGIATPGPAAGLPAHGRRDPTGRPRRGAGPRPGPAGPQRGRLGTRRHGHPRRDRGAACRCRAGDLADVSHRRGDRRGQQAEPPCRSGAVQPAKGPTGPGRERPLTRDAAGGSDTAIPTPHLAAPSPCRRPRGGTLSTTEARPP